MPLTRFIADTLSVVTLCLIVLLVLLGLFCVVYSIYFQNRIRGQGLFRLNYFTGPWRIRITCTCFAVCWGIGEIIRLSLFRGNGRFLNALGLKWQENLCKCYIIANLGFTEPSFFLSLVFLLRASLQKSGALGRNWNAKTAGFVLFNCLPMFVLQLVVILIAPKYKEENNLDVPSYFFEAVAAPGTMDNQLTICTYPLLSTIFLGLFATVLTCYLFWLGGRIVCLVINKGLQKRVYILIFSICSLFPLRVLLLGLSIQSKPEEVAFDVTIFAAFISLLCCAGVGIYILVYLPIADSLSLSRLQRDTGARMTTDGCSDTISLIPNHSPLAGSMAISLGRNSAASTELGSISFRSLVKGETSGADFVELSLFNPDQHSSPPGSPVFSRWPMTSRGLDKGA